MSVASATDAFLSATTGNNGDVSISDGNWQGTLPKNQASGSGSNINQVYDTGTNITFEGAKSLIFIGGAGSNQSYNVGTLGMTQSGKVVVNSGNSATTVTVNSITGAGQLSLAFEKGGTSNAGIFTLTTGGATFTSIDTQNGAGTLKIGQASTDTTTIINAISGTNLTVETVASSGGATGTALTLANTNGDATIKTLTLNADKSVLNVKSAGHKTTINDAVTLTAGKSLAINIDDTAELAITTTGLTNNDIASSITFADATGNATGGTFTGAIAGGTGGVAIKVGTTAKAAGIINGVITGSENTVTFTGTDAALTLKGNAAIKTFTAGASASNTLILDGTQTSTIKTLTIGGANTAAISLKDGATLAITNLTLTAKTLSLNFEGTGGIYTSALTGTGATALNVKVADGATGTIGSTGALRTITDGTISFDGVLSPAGTLDGSTLNANIEGNSVINVGKTGNKAKAIIGGNVNGAAVTFAGDEASLELKGTTNTLASIAGSGTIELGGSSTTLNVTALNDTDNLTFNLAGNVAERFLVAHGARTNLQTRTLTIADHQLQGDNSYVLLATTSAVDGNGAYVFDETTRAYKQDGNVGGSDKVVISDVTDGESPDNQISLVMKDGERVTGEDKYVILAEVKGTNRKKINFKQGTVDVSTGFSSVNFNLENKDDLDTGTTYYYTNLSSSNVQDASINADFVAPTTAALSAGVSVFSANLNSLSKRMGELRNDPYANGVWARVFAGEQTTNFGAKQSTVYSTFQAGYDYKLALEDASNYIGLALSYTKGAGGQVDPVMRETSELQTGFVAGLTSSNTDGVEVALYNSYVANSGLYSDTIVKAGYYMTDLTMFMQPDTYSTSNLAVAVSEEIGYKVKLGESNEWFITPQGEVAFAYMGGTEFTQNLDGEAMKSTQDAVSLLRARVGAAWGYDFSHLAKESDVKASLYVGTYYTYDYFIGGDTTLEATTAVSGLNAKYTHNAYEGTGRFVMNLGTNIDIKDSTKVYVDFEKSFGGSIQTDYQVSLGVRFGFGEKVSAPKQEKKANETSLKPKELEESAE